MTSLRRSLILATSCGRETLRTLPAASSLLRVASRHIAHDTCKLIVPITVGRGVSLWHGVHGLEERFTIESVASPSGLTHQPWNRNDHA